MKNKSYEAYATFAGLDRLCRALRLRVGTFHLLILLARFPPPFLILPFGPCDFLHFGMALALPIHVKKKRVKMRKEEGPPQNVTSQVGSDIHIEIRSRDRFPVHGDRSHLRFFREIKPFLNIFDPRNSTL